RDAALSGGVVIDLVRANTEAAYRDKSVCSRKHLLGQLGSGSNTENGDFLQRVEQRFTFKRTRNALHCRKSGALEQVDSAVVHILKQKQFKGASVCLWHLGSKSSV